MNPTYFKAFEDRKPPILPPPKAWIITVFQMMVGITLFLGAWYLHWRWTSSLNFDALWFSIIVVGAETGMFISSILFFFDIWDVGDTPPMPAQKAKIGGKKTGIDIFIATYNEDVALLEATIVDAKAVRCPDGFSVTIYLADDGARPEMCALAAKHGISYLSRDDNRGYKAGNLKNALFKSTGSYIVICDADTRLFPSFLENTLGYFDNPNVAWVQTPHWFYDLPEGYGILKLLPNGLRNALPLRLQGMLERVRIGRDPYSSDGNLFFDIIQRRRNRNGASFCCGAGSIHRRDAIMQAALYSWAKNRAKSELTPFCFHISEDILTSIRLHSNPKRKWESVYHPAVECKMLSPWEQSAWAGQKMRYATGTVDIMLFHNPIFSKNMDWQKKLHYSATFFSYISALWCLLLILAPIFTLFANIAPVASYSQDFFYHLVPLLISMQITIAVGCSGQNTMQTSTQIPQTLSLILRSFWDVIRGQRTKFKITPKNGGEEEIHRWRFAAFNFGLIAASLGSFAFALGLQLSGLRNFDASLLIVNGFWVFYNCFALSGPVLAVFFPPSLTCLEDSKSIVEVKL